MTAMTLQALAPYYGTNAKVKAAVDEALTLLKSNQDKTTGGFYSMGQYNSESTAQVIVALTSLGIDPASWAVSSTHTPITALLQFYSADTDGFKHVLNAGTDGMATEQAACALVAYSRYLKGRNTLYDMSDAGVTDEEFDRQKADSVIALIDDITEPITLLSEGAIHKAKAAYKLLKPSQKDLVTNYSKLEKAAAKLSELKVAESQRLISAIGKVSLDSEKAIETAKAYYAGLTQDEQAKVSNYPVLVAAERALVSLKNQQKSDDSKKPGNSASGGSSKSGGSTKTVTVEIDDVEYVVSEKTKVALDSIDGLLNPEDAENALPSDFANLTEEQINKIVDIYKQYAALTDDEKLFVDNYAEFEEVLNKLGEELHYDNSTGVDVRGNDSLKWHIELMVKPNTASDEQLAKMRKTLGEDADSSQCTTSALWIFSR